MQVDELIQYLQQLSAKGKGDYAVLCEGFCVEISIEDITIEDSLKMISL